MNVIVIVPYRPDNGHRDRIWAFLRDNYWCHTTFPIVLGEHFDGPFNRSKAINRAADRDWDVAVIADSDTWVPAKQLYDAVANAAATNALTSALTAVVEINQPCTESVLAGATPLAGSFDTDRVRTRDLETQSSVLAVPRTLWDVLGGMDERFVGWGGEDNAFWHAASLHQPAHRIPGNAYHLWHPTAPGKHSGIGYKRNLNLWRRYEQCRTLDDLAGLT